MKKYFLLIILLLNGIITAQSSKIAVLSNIPAIKENPALTADSIRRAVASYGEVNSLISLGNITADGSFQQMIAAKSFLDSMAISYKVLCGRNDFSQNFSALLNIRKLFDEDNFVIQSGNYALVGIQTIDFINNSKSHVTIETIIWLKNKIAELKNKKIILFLNSETSKIDNFDKLAPVMAGASTTAIITPDFFAPKKSESTSRKSKKIKKPVETAYLHILELRNDSLLTYSYSDETGFNLTGTKELNKINFDDFVKAPPAGEEFQSSIKSSSSAIAGILPYKDNLIISTLEGKITSYNPDFTAKWVYQLNGNIVSTPIITEGHLIAASTKGDIAILDPLTAAEVQSIGIDCEIVSPLTVIEFKGNKELLIPKSTNSSKALVFSGVSGEIFCYDLETLQELWVNNDSRSPLTRNIIDTGNKMIFKNKDGVIICLDTRSGQLIWRWGYKEMLADTKTNISYNGKQIVTLTNQNTLVGIDLLLGVPEWQSEKGIIKDYYLLPGDLKTITALTENKLLQIDSHSGKLIKDIKLKEKNISSFLPQDDPAGQPYVLTDDNILYRLDKSKSLHIIGDIGAASIASFYSDAKNNLFLLNFDGQLIKIVLN
jgi:outer membrane protein assembly factor BamB